jgi:long-chain acyl-CoA synthetase
MNIADILNKTSARLPKKVAYYFDDPGTTYQALQQWSESFAWGLQKMGIKKGDRVAVFSPNCLEFIISYFSVIKLGAILIPINIMLKAREARHIMENAEVNTLIVHHSQVEMVRALRPGLPFLKNLVVIGKQPLPDAVLFLDLLSEKPSIPMTRDCAPDDTATIIYTSGTTGLPKGAMLTHANFYCNAENLVKAMAQDENAVRVSVAPLFHIMGMSGNIMSTVYSGSTAAIYPKLDFEEFLKANEKYRATIISAPPALFYMLIHDPRTRNYDLSSWRMAVTGSAPMPVELLRKFEEKFQIPMVEGYALTESTNLGAINPPYGVRKPGSVGLPMPTLEVKILDDQDRELATGEIGEVALRGPFVMKGYYNNPEATAETLRGGWLHTGDLGKLDEDGYLYIVDRKKDMIICSGYNVYPREIEELLHIHPAVLEAAVIGMPDPKRGESPVAFIVLKPGQKTSEEELIQFSKENLATYKSIKAVQFIDEFPRNPNRKILKQELRKMLGK